MVMSSDPRSKLRIFFVLMRQLILGKVTKFLVEKLSVLQMCEDNEKYLIELLLWKLSAKNLTGGGDTPRAFRVNT